MNDVVKTAEELEAEIEKLTKIFRALRDSRLKRRTLVLLLHDMTKVSKKDINKILDAGPKLAERYLELGDS